MARTATTADVFNAIAEQHRRDILDVLVDREVAVGELVEELQLEQTAVSKHLKVLRTVDLVRSRTDGRRRLYRLNGPALEPVQHWLERYTAAVNEHYDRLDDYLATLQRSAAEVSASTATKHETNTTASKHKETRP